MDYSNITYSETIPFIPPVTEGKVIKVYDGDTITIASKMPYENSPWYRFSVRLNGIDTPEIKTKNENEKRLALIGRDNLKELIMDKIVKLKNVDLEKYGRILADVYLDDLYLNEWMIKKKYAVRYDGGTKQVPNDWMEYYNNN